MRWWQDTVPSSSATMLRRYVFEALEDELEEPEEEDSEESADESLDNLGLRDLAADFFPRDFPEAVDGEAAPLDDADLGLRDLVLETLGDLFPRDFPEDCSHGLPRQRTSALQACRASWWKVLVGWGSHLARPTAAYHRPRQVVSSAGLTLQVRRPAWPCEGWH